jgi:NADH dehydrogenase FAD-containing subunit
MSNVDFLQVEGLDSMTVNSQRNVVIIGGGYGGIAAAKALDADFNVTLIEKRERFFHNIGALRAAVDAAWLPKLFIPYDKLLKRGKVQQSTAVKVSREAVTLSTGETLGFDYLILATGSSYPFPAKMTSDNVAQASADVRRVNTLIKEARSILLIGAGPVGIEFAGEIASAYPNKRVTLTDPSSGLLRTFNPSLGKRITADLTALGVQLLLGERLTRLPNRDNPTQFESLSMQSYTTEKGTSVEADLYFFCYGATPNTNFLKAGFGASLDQAGRIKLNPHLQVEGYPNIFAVGDMTNIAEAKLASAARINGETVAANIRRLAASRADLESHEPIKNPLVIVPVGPDHGALQLPVGKNGLVLGAWAATRIKGKSLLVNRYWKALNADLVSQSP